MTEAEIDALKPGDEITVSGVYIGTSPYGDMIYVGPKERYKGIIYPISRDHLLATGEKGGNIVND